MSTSAESAGSQAIKISRLLETYDWNTSPLGPPSQWPDCLTAAVELILPSMAQIVIFWGPEFVALYNDAYAPTIGQRHPRAFGRPARENWSELWDDLEPLLTRVLDKGETVAAKDRQFYIERHGHPEIVYFDISYSPIHDMGGEVGGVFCVVSETTDRVGFEKALRESEERLRSVISQSSVGIGQTDLDGVITHVNQRLCEIVGYGECELTGMNILDIIHEEDRSEQMMRFRRLIETGESFELETRYVGKNGEDVWVNSSVSALRDSAGNIQQVAVVSIDISERKKANEAERRLASIIASSNDAILGIDLKMTITSWNAAAERLYGYTSDEIVGKSVLLLVPEDRAEEEPSLLDRIKAGNFVEPYETQRRHKDGRLVDISLSVSPIYDGAGRIIGASKIAHDISARKEAERMQSVLIGELHHRVKNVFATVMAIARQTFVNGRAEREMIDAFESRLSAMARAHDLLAKGDWQRAEVASVVEQATAPYPAERFEITGMPVSLPQRAVASLSLALHELCTNAAKYGALSGPNGKVAISWTHERPSGAFKLRWQETGGPLVEPPQKKGFGTVLIERVLAAELGGRSTVDYDSGGLIYEIEAVLSR